MKRFAIFLFLVISLTCAAHADEASRRAKAEEMMTLLHMDRLFDQRMNAMMEQMSTMTKHLLGNDIKPADQAKIDAFQKQVFQLIQSQISWKSLEPEYVEIYSKTFSDQELDSILVFYKSPAGAALLEKLPSLTAQGTQLSQARMVLIQPQLKQMLEDFAKNAAKNSDSTPAQPASTAPNQ